MLAIVIIQEDNNKEWTEACIQSIRNQGVKGIKCVSVGGPYCRAELLNKGILTSGSSEWLMFINAHEVLKEEYLKKTLAITEKFPDIKAIYTDYEKEHYREYLPSFNREKIASGWRIPTTALFKREIFEKCGNFDGSLEVLEDWDMWLRISHNFPAYHIPESLYLSKNKIEEISIEKFDQAKRYILEKQNGKTI